MHNRDYKKQVALMLRVLLEFGREECFALHGGTAINLFVRNMPRLSVDIDLIYVPIEDRQSTLANINEALVRTKSRIEGVIGGVRVVLMPDLCKIFISTNEAGIKVEVNPIARGTLSSPIKMTLCDRVRNEFDTYFNLNVVPFGQLYGGKICAALDRQHPRDLFDVKLLMDNEGFTVDVKEGFMLHLLGSERPIHEIIHPSRLDQRLVLNNQFEGMTDQPFSYEDFETTREKLIQVIKENLTDVDKQFLINFHNLTTDWSVYDFERFPSVKWKLLNLEKLKNTNPKKHRAQVEAMFNQ